MIQESAAHPHVPSERAELFHCHDACSTEAEYLELWMALVGATKPENVLETGSYFGYGTKALGAAVKRNGFGKLYTIELADNCIERTKNVIEESKLGDTVVQIKRDTREFLKETNIKFGLAVFDSNLDYRIKEFRICLERDLLEKGDYAVFHDSSKVREFPKGERCKDSIIFWEDFEQIQKDYDFEGMIHFPLSRGLTLIKI